MNYRRRKKRIQNNNLSLKIQEKFISVAFLVLILLLITLLSGCAKTYVKIVKVSDFCSGRYYSITEKKISKKDIRIIEALRAKSNLRPTIDKFIDYTFINEKEFLRCLNE